MIFAQAITAMGGRGQIMLGSIIARYPAVIKIPAGLANPAKGHILNVS